MRATTHVVQHGGKTLSSAWTQAEIPTARLLEPLPPVHPEPDLQAAPPSRRGESCSGDLVQQATRRTVQVAALISVLASENNEVAGGTCSHVLNDLSLSHNLSISPCLSCTHLASALR